MQLFDTHCHLDVSEFDADRMAVLARARSAGVTQMVVPAVDAAGWPALLDLCKDEPGLYPALGLHPIYLPTHTQADLDELRRRVGQVRPIAIGEIGLDYFVKELDRERQQWLLEQQLEIASEFELPVLLHVRKAHDQVLAMLKRMKFTHGGIAHAFNGSLPQAQQYLDLGFKLGFGGMITYQRSSKLRHLAADLPLEAIVLETDAPDMTPVAHHGRRNSPEYLPEILAALAELRGMTDDEVARQVLANSRDVLRL